MVRRELITSYVSASCNLHIKMKKIAIGENRTIQAKKSNGNLEFIIQDKKTSKLAVLTLSGSFLSFITVVRLYLSDLSSFSDTAV